MVVRELPTEIQRTIHNQAKALDGPQTAKLADGFFDKEGRPIHRPATSTVNNVEKVPDPVDSGEEEENVSAVNRSKPQHRQQRPTNSKSRNQNPNSKTPWAPKQGGQQGSQSGNQQQHSQPDFTAPFAAAFIDRKECKAPSTLRNVKLCRLHTLYGDKARSCEFGCAMYPKGTGNYKAGRQA